MNKNNAGRHNYLNRGNTEPLSRLLLNEAQGGPGQIITDGATIQEKIIQHNIEFFLKVEQTPLGKDTFLHDVIGHHGISEFCDQVLDGGLGPTDKDDINSVEAYEMLLHMERAKRSEPRSTMTWITNTLVDLFAPQGYEGEGDSDTDDEEPIAVENPLNNIRQRNKAGLQNMDKKTGNIPIRETSRALQKSSTR